MGVRDTRKRVGPERTVHLRIRVEDLEKVCEIADYDRVQPGTWMRQEVIKAMRKRHGELRQEGAGA